MVLMVISSFYVIHHHCTDPHQCHNHHKIDYSPHIIHWRKTGSIDLDVHLDSFNSAFDAFVDQ